MIDMVFDIETRGLSRERLAEQYVPKLAPDIRQPPKSCDTPAKVQKWQQDAMEKYLEAENERRAEFFDRAALSASTGEVVCIGWITGHEFGRHCPHLGQHCEADILQQWVHAATRVVEQGGRLIGHNVKGFDLPFIFQRCYVHGIKCGHLVRALMRGKWWREDRVGDTQEAWLLGTGNGFIKLNALARILGLPQKSASGDQVANMTFEAVARYCCLGEPSDVSLTLSIAARLDMLNIKAAWKTMDNPLWRDTDLQTPPEPA